MALPSPVLPSRPACPTVEPLESRITPGAVAFPSVLSIATVGKASTEDTTVSWKVTFSEPVTGVDASDFALALSGGIGATGTLTVTPVSATVYTVKTTGLIGSGTVGLNLVDDGSIRDVDNHPLKADSLSFSKPLALSGGNYISSVTTGDVNGDGKPDLVATDYIGSTVNVYLGNGDGSFQAKQVFSTGYSPSSVTIADLNGDGKMDLAVASGAYNSETSASTTVSVLLGNGDDTFQAKQNYGSGYGQMAVAAGDFNKDGKTDLAVTSNMSGVSSVNILLGNGDGTFQNQRTFATGNSPVGLVLGDVNKDGKLDVVVANTGDGTVSVLLGVGNGDLKAKTDFTVGASPNSVVLADFNGDGKLDLATANGGSAGTVSVLLGNGKGSFGTQTTFATGPQTAGISAADFDGDGKVDLAVTYQPGGLQPAFHAPLAEGGSGVVSVLLGNGNGTFQAKQDFFNPSSQSGMTALADFDGNGRIDIAAANGNNGSVSVLPNIGAKDFTGAQFTVGTVPADLAITGYTDNKTGAGPGDLLTYVVDFSNLSSKSASGVTLSVTLPYGASFVAKENPGWTLNGTTLTKTVGKLAGSKSGTAKVKLHVNKTTDWGSGLYTVATISDDGHNGEDSNGENNSRFDYDDLTGFNPDLTITSIKDGGLAVAGETNVYQINYANIGIRNASANITVTLPAGTTFNAGQSTAGWVDNNDGTFTLPYLTATAGAGNSSVNFAVDIAPDANTTVPLSLPAAISSPYYTDSNLANNSLTKATPFYSGFYVTSPGVAPNKKFAPPVIHVFDRATGLEVRSFLAYEPEYRDSIRVAVGDFNGDGIDDIVTTTQGGTGRLRVFDGLTGEQFGKGAFSEEIAVFNGTTDKGAFVAVGDVNGDGNTDIVVGSALGGGKVKVYAGGSFDEETGGPVLLKEYMPFGADFKGGVRVAVGDVNGGGTINTDFHSDAQAGLHDDIIVGQGYYGGRVIVYDGATDTKLRDFSVGGPTYKGGVSVSAGDLDGDGLADIVVGRNSGKPSLVEAFSGLTLAPIGKSINPFDANPNSPKNIYGVRVAVVDVNLDGVADIITSVGIKGGSQVKVYSGIRNPDGTYNVLEDRTMTAYGDYPDVALWVAGSSSIPSILL